MATNTGSLSRLPRWVPARATKAATRSRRILQRLRVHPAWLLCCALLLYIAFTRGRGGSDEGLEDAREDAREAASLMVGEDLTRARAVAARSGNGTYVGADGAGLGNSFCVLQPTLSAGKTSWGESDARSHIALRAFMRTFATTVTEGERKTFKFSIYYGHDSDDAVFGSASLRAAFEDEAAKILSNAGFAPDGVKLVFTPLYGLHGRINAIWNVLAKDAYYDGCDYFFLSNDDMVFFTEGWVSRSRDSLSGIGSAKPHKRPCRYFGTVRFKDEWASWATFTFHVATRLHMEIFGGVCKFIFIFYGLLCVCAELCSFDANSDLPPLFTTLSYSQTTLFLTTRRTTTTGFTSCTKASTQASIVARSKFATAWTTLISRSRIKKILRMSRPRATSTTRGVMCESISMRAARASKPGSTSIREPTAVYRHSKLCN